MHKGAIAVQILYGDSALLVLNGTSLKKEGCSLKVGSSCSPPPPPPPRTPVLWGGGGGIKAYVSLISM